MTNYQINRVGSDQVTLQLMQEGSSETSVTLRHTLLDDKLPYHFAVTSLSVPLNNAPIMQISAETELFRIERRNAGQSLAVNANVTIEAPFAAPFTSGSYRVTPDRRFFDTVSFMRDLSNYARAFNHYQTLIGIPDLTLYGGIGNVPVGPLVQLAPKNEAAIDATGAYTFLVFKLTADGRLSIQGSTHFWNSFVLRFSTFGAELLGMSNLVHAMPLVGGVQVVPNYFVAFTTNGAGVQTNTAGWVTAAGPLAITQGGNFQDASVVGDSPLYQLVDQRVKVSVESHLPISAAMSVIDEVQTTTTTICEKYFETMLETSTAFNSDGTFSGQELSTRVYSGQVSFVKKADRISQWQKLLTAYELKFFRFHLYIWYRAYSAVSNTWTLKKQRLDVPERKYWELELLFVSDT
jgi:hypothetical protein